MTVDGARILIIDDEKQIRRLLRVALEGYGYKISEAASGQEGLRKITSFHPDLVILDIGLPDINGQEMLKKIRGWSEVPIIILSVHDQEEEKIQALDSGANDYVTKPFSMGELLARIRATLRHVNHAGDEPVIAIGELSVDFTRRLVTKSGEKVKLTPTEYEILKQLTQNAGRVLTHKHLLRSIWGSQYERETHYLRVYIASLRRKIESDPTRPEFIITEPGVGYRLIVPKSEFE